MDSGGVNSTNIASAVWLASTRNLTGMGASAMALVAVARTSLAASTAVDLRPAASKMREITVGIISGAAGATVLSVWDGTNAFTLANVTTSTTGAAYGTGTATTGLRLINNDATNPSGYQYGGVDWSQ